MAELLLVIICPVSITFKLAHMDLRNEDLPVTLQAFDLLDNKEIFIAEQVVNSRSDVDLFTKRYAGKLIKAKKATVNVNDNRAYSSNVSDRRKKSSGGVVAVVIILILLALVAYGFYTGWIQEKLHLKV